MKQIIITAKGSLTLDKLRQLYQRHIPIRLDQSAKAALQKSADIVTYYTKSKKAIYGINTGFGKLAHIKIPSDKLTELQQNLIISHAAGTGAELENRIVKLITALKVASLARGYSGIRINTVEAFLKLHNQEIYAAIPGKGSVGASGDLAPLAHWVLPLLGIGNCHDSKGNKIAALEALKRIKLNAINLAPKEGLALINGTQVSTALALAALFEIEKVFEAALLAGCLSLIAIRGSVEPYASCIQKVRGQLGQIVVAERLRHLLEGSVFETDETKVQDPYSIRCQPQVMGACLDQLQYNAQILAREINAVTDNSLIFPDDNAIMVGGNFHAEPIAIAADVLAIVITEIASISERRIALLMDGHMSGLPDFLAVNPGLYSGFMITQVTAAALLSENKSLAYPSSVDNIPTSANQEDHVSMSTNAARRLLEMVDNTTGVVAIELLAACQGIDFVKPKKLSLELKEMYEKIRAVVPFIEHDYYMADAIAKVKELIKRS